MPGLFKRGPDTQENILRDMENLLSKYESCDLHIGPNMFEATDARWVHTLSKQKYVFVNQYLCGGTLDGWGSLNNSKESQLDKRPGETFDDFITRAKADFRAALKTTAKKKGADGKLVELSDTELDDAVKRVTEAGSFSGKVANILSRLRKLDPPPVITFENNNMGYKVVQ